MIAASGWDEPAQLMTVRPSTPGSYERLFHDAGLPAFVLPMEDAALRSALEAPRLERAIGVIYRPDTERASHYFTARLPEQFDMVIHIDTTRAVQPLEKWSRHELDLPETYPTGVEGAAMSVHDVPRRRWMEVLEEFSRDHRGWLASVVTVGPDPELVSSTTLRPLESVTVGPDEGRPTALRVGFQGGPAVFVTAPRTLAVDRRHDGAERALEINAADATFVRIAFRATALPEELDGIAPTELTAGPAQLKS